MPKVSVVLPAYNAEKYLRSAIESMLCQTYLDFSLIIIDDGSSDSTAQIIDSVNDHRVIYLRNEKNQGLIYTLNRGLAFAESEYIARMDADDYSLPRRLEKQVEFLDAHPFVGVLGSQIEFLDENLHRVVHRKVYPLAGIDIAWELLFQNSIAHPSVMFRSCLRDQGLRYAEQAYAVEDYELWTKMAHVTLLANLPDKLLLYRRHAGAISESKKEQQLANTLQVRSNYFKSFGNIEVTNRLMAVMDAAVSSASEEEKARALMLLTSVYFYLLGENILQVSGEVKVHQNVLEKLDKINALPLEKTGNSQSFSGSLLSGLVKRTRQLLNAVTLGK